MNKKTIVAALVTLVFSSSLFANQNDFFNGLQRKALNDTSSMSTQEKKDFKESAIQKRQQHLDYINQLMGAKKQQHNGKGGKAADGAVMFVSFSMPDPLLVSLSEEAHDYDIPLVVRGLVENDFKKTLLRLASLKDYASAHNKTFHGISIDPVWFAQFNINAVPALVVTRRPVECEFQKQCLDQEFDVLFGNASVQKGLEVMADKSELFSDIAKSLLQGERL